MSFCQRIVTKVNLNNSLLSKMMDLFYVSTLNSWSEPMVDGAEMCFSRDRD